MYRKFKKEVRKTCFDSSKCHFICITSCISAKKKQGWFQGDSLIKTNKHEPKTKNQFNTQRVDY